MKLIEKIKDAGKTAFAIYFAIGLSYGSITFPYDNPFTNSRACAAFRTDEVKQKAQNLQSKVMNEVYEGVIGK